MRLSTALACSVLAAFVFSCSKQPSVRTITITPDGLYVHAAISPSRADGSMINGRILVRNLSSSFARYGNAGLTLVASGDSARTHVRTARADAASDSSKIDPMVDSRLIDLAPGDSIVFVSYWKFNRPVDMRTAEIGFAYHEPTAPVEPDTAAGIQTQEAPAK